MTTKTIDELDKEIAAALKWKCVPQGGKDYYENGGKKRHKPPHDYRELVKLMCEFDIDIDWWPSSVASRNDGRVLAEETFDETNPASKEKAFVRCAMLGILERVKQG